MYWCLCVFKLGKAPVILQAFSPAAGRSRGTNQHGPEHIPDVPGWVPSDEGEEPL